jgi:hypothetical protein
VTRLAALVMEWALINVLLVQLDIKNQKTFANFIALSIA